MTPLIVTLTGPCCSGKSTLERALAARGFEPAVSTTTRKPREGEVDGVAYHFVSVSQFKRLQLEQGLVESVEFNGNLYGVSAAEVARIAALGKPATVVCEPHGHQQIVAYAKARGWKTVSVYVDVPADTFARRFLERFNKDIESRPTDEAVEIYAKRLATAISDEFGWAIQTKSYDFMIKEYCMETQYKEINRLVEWVDYLVKNGR